jgi:sugar-specific transcriptional regulator TrmB
LTVGEEALIEQLSRELELPVDEARLYVAAVREGGVRESDAATKRLANSLLARGMLIRGGRDGYYRPVHPRLALSNLFRAYEEKMARARKEKRLLTDRLTLELIPLYDQSKDTNLGRTEGRVG